MEAEVALTLYGQELPCEQPLIHSLTHSFFKHRLSTYCVSGPVGSLAWLGAGDWSQVPLGDAGSSGEEDWCMVAALEGEPRTGHS